MIRVDLGKDDLNRGRGKLSKLFGGGKKGGGGKGGKIGKLGSDAKSVVTLGIAFALALLPYLGVEQYKSYSMENNEAQKRVLQEKIDMFVQQTQNLEPYRRELESYENQKRLVRERIDLVQQLVQGRNSPVSVLDAIGQALPKRAWLTKVDLRVNTVPPEALLSGEAYGNEDISDFVDGLQKSIFISEVTLKTVSKAQSGQGGFDVKTFEIRTVPKIALSAIAPRQDSSGALVVPDGSVDPNAAAGADPAAVGGTN